MKLNVIHIKEKLNNLKWLYKIITVRKKLIVISLPFKKTNFNKLNSRMNKK
jgi:benzoyl-CoA reductase/2-hydroxyglutaryl-CoA dehydratase subunit BcrC/BadD/HgdB